MNAATPSIGDQLGPLTLPVTYLRCVQCVAATRDFNPLHFDREVARAAGTPDVFLNTMTYQGLFGRLVASWAGPQAFIRMLGFEMVQPTIPGDVLTISGHVTGALTISDERAVSARLMMETDRVGVVSRGEAFVSWRDD